MEKYVCKAEGCDREIQLATVKRNDGLCGPCAAAVKRAEMEKNRQDVNLYAGIEDPVEIIKIMLKPLYPNPMFNYLPYHKTLEELVCDLDSKQIDRLVKFAARKIKSEGSAQEIEVLLCALAALTDASLTAIQNACIAVEDYHPPFIFRKASAKVRNQLIDKLDSNEENRRLILYALAWIGDDIVIENFPKWIESQNNPATDQPDQVSDYTHDAGWEIDTNNQRRNLYLDTCYPLIQTEAKESDSFAVINYKDQKCPYCSSQLATFLDLNLENTKLNYIPYSGSNLTITSCPICSCFSDCFFMELEEDNKPKISQYNKQSEYLPLDRLDELYKPTHSYTISSETRESLCSTTPYLNITFSQIGGMPTWEQDHAYPACPKCGQTMIFIGQIANNDFDKLSEGIYYSFLCSDCNITAMNYQQT